MQRVERHIILNSKAVDQLCFKSKNLYNLANYYIRQNFVKSKTWLRYQTLDKLLKQEQAYKDLPAQTSQQVLRVLDKSWISFFNAVKSYKKNPNNFKSRPKLPGYKDKIKGRNLVVFTNQQVKLRDGLIYFPERTNLEPLRTKVPNLNQVRIVSQATCYVIEVIYTKEAKTIDLNPNTYLSIDLGVNNLATCVNNIGKKPFIINGRILKSMNQYFNKKRAQLMSYIGGKGTSNRLDRLIFKRNNKVQDYLHKTSRFIINYCVQHKISTIVIGNNKAWKQEINLGRRNNQCFVFIPFGTLIKQVEYKAEEYGIKVLVNEESYSSKCSFLDLETVEKHLKYLGRRIKRGLFRSAKRILINADANGAYNVLTKVVPNAFSNGIEGVGLHPVLINIS